MSGRDITVLVLANALDRAPKVATFARPLTVADAVRRQKLAFRLPTIAIVAGKGEPRPVLRRDWGRRRLRRGETLVFVGVPGRGGDGGSILALIAAVALSVVAPLAGGAIAGALFGGSAIASSLVTAGIVLGGSLLINAFLGPGETSAAGAEPVYTAAASSNRAAPLGTVPCAYGYLRMPPPLAARPYQEFEGNDQILYQLHCPSLGVWHPKRWEIGTTLAWTAEAGFTDAFTGIDIEIVHPGDDITLFPANVVVADTVSGQTVPDPPDVLGPFTVNAAGTGISEIAADFVFPAGLYARGGDGGAGSATRRLIVRTRAIDDEGAPVGPGTWSTLFDETFTRKTPTPQRFTRKGAVAPGRYEATFEAADADTSDAGQVINRVAWAGLRGYLSDWQVPPGVTLIATRIRANDQLSQRSANEYFFTGQRALPVYDGAAWSAPAETSAIAWAAADILRNADYGAGLDDARFDLDWLAAYDVVWAGRGDTFNAVFDRAVPIAQALDTVLRAGRAFHVRLGGRLGFVRDEPRFVRRHVFGPGNTLRGSHSRRDIWFDEEAPDSARVRYLDASVWAFREVTAAIAAVGATTPVGRELVGVTDRDQAWREGIYAVAQNVWRRSFRSFQVEHEGRQLVRGDAVLYHDPLTEEAAVARLAARDGDTLSIDRDFAPEDGETYHLMVRDRRGREWGPVLIDGFPDARTVELDATDRLVVESQHGLLDDVLPADGAEAARLSILAGDYRLFDGLLVSARPVSDRFWEVLIVNDDQRVHLADETEIVPAPYTPPALFQPPPEAPAIEESSFYAAARNGTVHIEVEAGWRPAPGAFRYAAEISYDDDAAADPEAASWTPVHDGVGTRFTAVILPQPFALRAAAIGVRQGPWRYRTVATVPAPQLPPRIVGPTSLDPVVDALMAQLRTGLQASIDARIDRIVAEIEGLAAAGGGAWAVSDRDLNASIETVGQRAGENEARVTTLSEAAADLQEAIARHFVGLSAKTPSGEAEVLWRMVAAVLPEGAIAAIDEELRAGFGGEIAKAARRMVVYADPVLGLIARQQFEADQIDLITPAGVRKMMTFGQTDGFEEAPVAGGIVEPDLRNRQLMHRTVLTGDATLRAPLTDGIGFWFHAFVQDGTGGWELTPDPTAYIGQPPTIATGANVATVCFGIVMSTNPPLYAVVDLLSGALEAGSTRQLLVSPAVAGRTLWHLDVDGPLTIDGPGAGTITPVGAYLDCAVEMWSAGGPTDGVPSGGATEGEDSSFGDMVLTPGGASKYAPGAHVGAGGTASGGDENEDGEEGGLGEIVGSSARGGNGKAAPGTEASALFSQFANSSNPVRDGRAGDTDAQPGGEGVNRAGRSSAGGALHASAGGPLKVFSGGAGARSKTAYGEDELLQGVAYPFVLGAGGAGGTGSSVKGARGAPARLVIT